MSKPSVYEIVTDRIISAMDEGIVPWRTPWRPGGGPTSLSTGKAYRGVNHLILDLVTMTEGFTSPLWGTFKQAQALGGSVRKGEKATPIVLWKPGEKVNAEGARETFLMVRYFSVFNVDQMEGVDIPERFTAEREPVAVHDGVAQALAYPGGPTVTHSRQDRAYYSPDRDLISLPDLSQFRSPSAYAETALHEVIHSTGHPSRLDRLDKGATFGCQTYAKEELVAEVGAAMLATSLGVEIEWEQSAAYVASWLKVLKDDRKLIVSAAQTAQKAVDLVMGSAVVTPEAETVGAAA
jgi:antirestriction protein ArdC